MLNIIFHINAKRELVTFFVWLCGVMLHAQSASVPVGMPSIRFEQSILDVGTLSVGKGEKRKVTFCYENRGTAPLEITHYEAGCACAKVKLPKKPLKPGKRGKLVVTVDATDIEDRGVYGNVITIYTNAPKKYIRIRVTGQFTD